jgi:pantoate--beta-alanine ligase
VLELIETIGVLRERLNRSTEVEPYKNVTPRTIGLVPTMGALHAGHAALIDRARHECGLVVVSIFINPLQFNDKDDLARYPQTLDADLAQCRELGADIVFAPTATEMYPAPPECGVDIGRLGDHLCGKFRPGHFRGVATVVLKLFQIVQPHRAYFGEKDAQQLAIIRRLVADFNVPATVVEVPTVREADGLAMSSRNRHLSPDERRMAACLYRSLVEASRMIAGGERNAATVRQAAAATVPHSDALKLEYLEIVDPETMQPVDQASAPVRIAGALWVGKTRLIDNVLVEPYV